MNSTTSKAELRRNGDTLADNEAESASRTREAAIIQVGKLTADVDELVKKLRNVTDAEIVRMRDKVQRTLTTTRETLDEGSGRIRASGRRVLTATDTYVHERPWTALGIVAAAGALIGGALSLSARRH